MPGLPSAVRCRRRGCCCAVLSGEPVPAASRDLQSVLHALAWFTAGAITGQFTVLELSDDQARTEALACVENRLAILLPGGRLPDPSDPLPL